MGLDGDDNNNVIEAGEESQSNTDDVRGVLMRIGYVSVWAPRWVPSCQG